MNFPSMYWWLKSNHSNCFKPISIILVSLSIYICLSLFIRTNFQLMDILRLDVFFFFSKLPPPPKYKFYREKKNNSIFKPNNEYALGVCLSKLLRSRFDGFLINSASKATFQSVPNHRLNCAQFK